MNPKLNKKKPLPRHNHTCGTLKPTLFKPSCNPINLKPNTFNQEHTHSTKISKRHWELPKDNARRHK
jgi:hypothetical protein